MKTILLIALLSCSFINAQSTTVETIPVSSITDIPHQDKNLPKYGDVDYQETVFVLFEKEEVNRFQKSVNFTPAESEHKIRNDYRYTYRFNSKDNIYLNYREFEDFDQMLRNNPEPFFKVDKSFLRKNKEIIYTSKEILKMGYERMSEIVGNAKNVFIIDLTEENNSKITIKEVHYWVQSIE